MMQLGSELVVLVLPKARGARFAIIPMQFIHGVSTAGRVTAGYCMMSDFSPKKYQSILGSLWNVSEGLVVIYLTIYFRYISPNWYWVEIFAISQGTICLLILIFLIPESPKWLYDNKKYKKCYECLQKIASYNGKDN